MMEVQGQQENLVKLFVGQVPPEMTEDDLKSIFLDYGDVKEVIILKNRATGLSKGAGFIKYATKEEAQAAINALHEQRTLGAHHKALQVKYADAGPAENAGTFVLVPDDFVLSYSCLPTQILFLEFQTTSCLLGSSLTVQMKMKSVTCSRSMERCAK